MQTNKPVKRRIISGVLILADGKDSFIEKPGSLSRSHYIKSLHFSRKFTKISE